MSPDHYIKGQSETPGAASEGARGTGAVDQQGTLFIMSDAFKDREKGFERKYEMDQDLEFRVHARRDKLFGLWLAERFGLTGDDAKAYATEVVESNFERPGDEDLMDKVKADLVAKNVTIEDKELRQKFEQVLGEAHTQLTET